MIQTFIERRKGIKYVPEWLEVEILEWIMFGKDYRKVYKVAS